MNFLSDVFDITLDPQIIAALVGILSMVVARLLDWYFPSRHHRKIDYNKVEVENDEEETK